MPHRGYLRGHEALNESGLVDMVSSQEAKTITYLLFDSGSMPGVLCTLLNSYSNSADMISIYKLRKRGDES